MIRIVRERTPEGRTRVRVNPKCEMLVDRGECGKPATVRVRYHWDIYWCPEHAHEFDEFRPSAVFSAVSGDLADVDPPHLPRF